MSGLKHELNLRGVGCPMNFVKTLLKLEELTGGDLLEVLLDPGEPVQNVPRSVREEGHRIRELARDGDGYRLLIEKKGVG